MKKKAKVNFIIDVLMGKGEGHYREYRVERNSTPLLEKSVKQMEESSSSDTRDISHSI